MNKQDILGRLPYSRPFLFVDELHDISEDRVFGSYTFKKDEFFYSGHFKSMPVTPGVILTECMAQIGLVCLGLKLQDNELKQECQVAMSHSNIDFFLPVRPGEKVWVRSQKVYFRFNKLKCKVQMETTEGKLICKGEISGMIKYG